MKSTKNSGKDSVRTVVVPEFSTLITDVAKLDKITSDGFSYANAAGRKTLFSMRSFIDFVYPECLFTPDNEDDYISVISRISKFIKNHSDDTDTSIVFPGYLPLPDFHISNKSWNKLLSISGDITVDATNEEHLPAAINLLENVPDAFSHIGLITSHRTLYTLFPYILSLWKRGVELTICDSENIKEKAYLLYGSTPDSIALSDGIITLPGKTVFSCIPFILSEKSSAQDCYVQIKDSIKDILNSEINARFRRSAKRNLVYRTDKNTGVLRALSLCYPRCTDFDSDCQVKGILSGGATSDIISVYITTNNVGFNSDTVRFISAACKYYEDDYPLKILPMIHDVRYASSSHEVLSALAEHCEMCYSLFGNSILELYVHDMSDVTSVTFISEFFASGGSLLKVKKQGVSIE